MKIYKIIYLIIVIVLLSGCCVEYNINITDFEFTEDVNVYVENDKEQKSLEYYLTDDIIAFTYDNRDFLYNTEEISGEKKGINLNFRYTDLAAYSLSSFFTKCYEKSNISTDEEKIYIKATNYMCQGYNYNDVSYAIINLTTNHEVVEHNADKVDNGVYIWNIGNTGKDINLELKIKANGVKQEEESDIKDEDNQQHNVLNEQNKKTSIVLVILLLIGFIAALALAIIFKVNKKQR